MTGLRYVPDLADDVDPLTAALAWADAGAVLAPIRPGTKNPGSILGSGWQHRTSADPEVIVSWFAGRTLGLALHTGPSCVVALDGDHPDRYPEPMRAAIADLAPPFQSTRPDEPGRGHYLFAAPPGRRIGNGVGRLGPGWGEVRAASNGVIVLAPTPHTSPGGRYRWDRTGPLPVLPASIADLLDDALAAETTATSAEVEEFFTAHTAGSIERTRRHVRGFRGEAGKGGPRHDAAVRAVVFAMKDARAGLLDAREVAGRLREEFVRAVTTPRGGDRVESPAAASAEFDRMLSWAIAQAATSDPAETRRRLGVVSATFDEDTPADAVAHGPQPRAELLAGVRSKLAAYVEDDDPNLVEFVLAVAVSASDTIGEPLWGMVVGAPSSGKTEHVRLLDDVVDRRVDELTAAGLLSHSRAKVPKPIGLLTEIADPAFVTIGDFSPVLATSDKGGRDMLFALLRRVYDGAVSRRLGNSDAIAWEGRLTFLSAVTPSIDAFAAHADALGPRWLYLRLAEAPDEARRRRAAVVRRDLRVPRASAAAAARRAVEHARRVVGGLDLDEDARQALADVAVVATAGRGDVPRDGYGRRDVIGVAVVEEPHRLVGQLQALTRGALALGVPPEGAVALARRCALDTVPRARYAALEALAAGESLTVRGLASRAALHPNVARIALDDLRELGLACCPVEDTFEEDPRENRKPRDWQLTRGRGDLAADVLHEVRVYTKKGDPPPISPSTDTSTTSQEHDHGVVPHSSCTPAARAAS